MEQAGVLPTLTGAPPQPSSADVDAAVRYYQEGRLPVQAARDIPAELERMPPPWIAGQAVEPIEFGALSDPVSQAAFLGAPGLLRGMKGVGEAIATPGPSRGLSGFTGAPYRYGERGNLGPVPQGPPPQPEGTVRLYRGETTEPAKAMPAWIAESPEYKGMQGAAGRWWTDDPAIAAWYQKDAGEAGRIVYQDVPKAVAEKAHVARQPGEIQRYSLDPQREYFLPPEYKGRGRPHVPEATAPKGVK